ncbi:RNA dependent RNA polymerase [Thermoanaerobacterium thermosulfurigenes]|uniref:RNA dependent RNA polymerase n=1 Tax=Thermoanaerobacterium thermosulfurigenes TaxID=33950 RepID=UPI003EFB05FD
MRKRRMYSIYQISINHLGKDVNDNKIQIGENLITELIQAIKHKEYNEYDENFIPELVYLVINDNSEKTQEKLKNIDINGFEINGIKYKRLGKSPAMTRTGRIAFVDETLKEQLEELIMLGKHVDKAVISKYEAYRGLSFSTCLFSPVVPRNVCIIDEYKTKINEYVKTIKDNQIVEGNFDVETTLWDGMGVHDPKWGKKIAKSLDIPYTPVGYQIRMFPSIKGMSYEFDFKAFYKEKGISTITDIYDKTWNIDELDAIWNTSMFKFWKYFTSWNEFIELREKYYAPLNMDKIGIAKWVIPSSRAEKYSKTSYQYLQSLALSGKDVIDLASYTKELVENVYKGDVDYTLAFLGLISRSKNEDETELEINNKILAGKMYTALQLNPELIFKDPYFKSFIKKQLQRTIDEMKLGRLYIEGRNSFIVQDPIAYLENAVGLLIKGCLNKGEFYSVGLEGYRATFRSPLIHSSEIGKDLYVNNDLTQKWLSRYDNVLVLNAFDLTAAKHSGSDFDGDTYFHTSNKMVINAVITENNPIIVNLEDKATAKAEPINDNSILQFDLRTLDNKIGKITNMATFWTTLGSAKGNVNKFDDKLTKLRIYQGIEIDSAKTGIHPQIDDDVRKYADKYKPYFLQKYQYGKNYNIMKYADKATMNILCKHIENWEQKNFVWDKKEYTDANRVAEYIINREYMREHKELYAKVKQFYIKYKQNIAQLHLKKASDEEYSRFFNLSQIKFDKISDDKKALAMFAIYVNYIDDRKSNKSYLFPWLVASEGILKILEEKQEETKRIIKSIDKKELEELEENVKIIEMLGKKFKSEIMKIDIHVDEVIKQNKERINIETSVVNCKGEEFAKAIKENDIVTLMPKYVNDIEYVGLFQNDEYLGCIPQNQTHIDINTCLKDYYDTQFKVEIVKVNQKSAKIKLNMIADFDKEID